MKINISEKWLPVFEALDSDVRIKIINLLAEKDRNIKELAQALGLSSAIITMHIKKLEKAKIIKCDRIKTTNAVQKLCSLDVTTIDIQFPSTKKETKQFQEFSIPVGHYSDYKISPTCGISTMKKIIGQFDDPRYFLDPERMNADIIWFSEGYVNYMIPNYLLSIQEPIELEISLELGSEAPGVNNNWPSDISFYLNNVLLCTWTSPGDFGGKRGKFTPEWWSLHLAQFGLFKVIRINELGTYIDGIKSSDVKLSDLNISEKYWNFKIEVPSDAKHVGGVTIFGKNFGNYNQDIQFKLFYK